MSEDFWKDDPNLARQVVREGLAVLKKEGGPVVKIVGRLNLLSTREADAISVFGNSIDAYFQLEKPKRPLCLGVFGPPGSGKSLAVEEVLAASKHAHHLVNLPQLLGPHDLSLALARVANAEETPVVFFDEFDCKLGGTSLGWLQWLLAPMQDGEFLYEGISIKMKRAVFVFAGGTADRFEEFPEAHAEYFRGAKGPDFISRLRGHMNILGVNDGPYRRVRRAIILRLNIERVAPGLLDDQKRILEASLNDELIDQILAVGRFRHGSRSVEALVEMSTTPAEPQRFKPPKVLTSHVDLGPLSDRVIALSAGGGEKDYDKEKLDAAWPDVASSLLELGAGLIYGGNEQKQGFTARLNEGRLPKVLGSEEEPSSDLLARPRSSRVTWIRRETVPLLNELPSQGRVDVRSLPDPSEEELPELSNAYKGLRSALSLFRMRALITRLADAQLVFGGKLSGSSGRFPGIAEEVMLSLANGNAIYICGGFGGAARAVGQVLGLDKPWALMPDCLRLEAHGEDGRSLEVAVKHKQWGRHFQLPHRNDLPLEYETLVEFLRAHAIGSPKWPDNGLTLDENRTLFRLTDAQEIVKLVTKGMRRRSAPPPAPTYA